MTSLLCALLFTTSLPTNNPATPNVSNTDTPANANATSSSLAPTENGAQDPAAQPAAKTDPAKDGLDMRVFWKDGFRMETTDKSFSMRISGRFQNDWAWFSADEEKFEPVTGELNDGTEIRRAYLGFDGKIFGDWDWKLEWDLAKAGNDFADAFIARPTGTIGYLKVGHFKQPMGLEELTNDLNTTFMERSLQMPFKTGRDVGVMLSDTAGGEAVTWAAGVFRDTNVNGTSSSSTSDDEYSFTGRGTWSPLYQDGGERVVHVGLSASWRNPTGNDIRFTAKPEANLAPTFLDTGAANVAADDYWQYGVEGAAVFGPISFQGEFMQAMCDGASAGGDDPTITGYYVYGSYFLTGEHRPYKRSAGVFDRVKPKNNHTKDGGAGAWEVGLRYTSIDFSEAVVGDQTMNDITAGLNWYVNPYIKVQLNVIQSNLERATLDEDAIITELRFQFDI